MHTLYTRLGNKSINRKMAPKKTNPTNKQNLFSVLMILSVRFNSNKYFSFLFCLQAAFNKLQKMLCDKWDFIYMQAEEQVR